MNLEKTIRSLKERGFAVSYFDSGEEAADYLTGEIRGCTVGFGGCQTAQQLGLYERLREENQVFWHWREPGAETIAKANAD